MTERDGREERLAAVWREVLEVERVGLDDSFFDLGGSSAALPRLQAAIRERLGAEVPLVELFRHPTVRALAAWLAAGEGERPEEDADRGASRGHAHAEDRRAARARRRDARRRGP